MLCGAQYNAVTVVLCVNLFVCVFVSELFHNN